MHIGLKESCLAIKVEKRLPVALNVCGIERCLDGIVRDLKEARVRELGSARELKNPEVNSGLKNENYADSVGVRVYLNAHCIELSRGLYYGRGLIDFLLRKRLAGLLHK
jgi:hypothetical protein